MLWAEYVTDKLVCLRCPRDQGYCILEVIIFRLGSNGYPGHGNNGLFVAVSVLASSPWPMRTQLQAAAHWLTVWGTGLGRAHVRVALKTWTAFCKLKFISNQRNLECTFHPLFFLWDHIAFFAVCGTVEEWKRACCLVKWGKREVTRHIEHGCPILEIHHHCPVGFYLNHNLACDSTN